MSGTRLRAVGLLGDDGSWQWTGWHDVMLGEPCSFITAADGVTRCVPTPSAALWVNGPRFLGTDCTGEPIALDGRGACEQEEEGAPTHAIRFEVGEDCSGEVRHLHRLGESLGRPTVVSWIAEDGSCAATDVTPLEDGVTQPDAYEILEELAAEDFVSAEPVARGERLRWGVLQASDGASAPMLALPFDSELGATCNPVRAADGVVRCLPRAWSRIVYADAACNAPIWPMLSSLCPDSPVVLTDYAVVGEPDADGCAQDRYRVYELGNPNLASTPVETFTTLGDACEARPNDASLSYLPVGEELPPETFASTALEAAECGPDRSSGSRLQAVYMTTEGFQASVSFLDAETGVFCSYQAAVDGVLRCLPLAVALGTDYADDACTRPAASYSLCTKLDSESDSRRSRNFAWSSVEPSPSPAACAASGMRIHALTGPELSVGYSLDDDGACVEIPMGQDAAQLFFREVGAEVPAASFVAATEEY